MPTVSTTLGVRSVAADSDVALRSGSAAQIAARPNRVAAPITILPVTKVATSPVPAGFPTSQLYQTPAGAIWKYNPTTGSWYQASSTPIAQPKPSSLPQPSSPVATQPPHPVLPPVTTPPPPAASVPPPAVPQNTVPAAPSPTTPAPPAVVPTTPSIPVAANSDAAAAIYAPGTVYLDQSTGQPTQVPASAAPAGDFISNAEGWLQSSSLINGIPNYWLAGGALFLGVLLGSGKRRR